MTYWDIKLHQVNGWIIRYLILKLGKEGKVGEEDRGGITDVNELIWRGTQFDIYENLCYESINTIFMNQFGL